MVNLANPTTFVELTRRVLPWLAAATLVLFVAGLWLSFAAPPDYQQGETVKIMYLHVPAAWMATFVYAVMTAAALGTLVWRHPLADAAQRAARRRRAIDRRQTTPTSPPRARAEPGASARRRSSGWRD